MGILPSDSDGNACSKHYRDFQISFEFVLRESDENSEDG